MAATTGGTEERIGPAAPLDFRRAEVELLERAVELKRLREELERLGAARK